MKMLYVGGTGRSGTTVVKRCIAEDPCVASFSRELRWMCDPGGLVDLYQGLVEQWDPYRGTSAVALFEELYRSCWRKTEFGVFARFCLSRIGFSGPKYSQLITKDRHKMIALKNRFLAELGVTKSRAIWYGSPSLRFRPVFFETERVRADQFLSAVNHFVEEIARAEGFQDANYLLDDTPYSVLNYHALSRIFPNAKFVNVVRDPFQVAESYARQPWASDLSGAITRLAAVYEELIRIERCASSHNWLTLRLEDLVRQPDEFGSEIAQFLDCELQSLSVFKSLNAESITPSCSNLGQHSERRLDSLRDARDFYGYSDG